MSHTQEYIEMGLRDAIEQTAKELDEVCDVYERNGTYDGWVVQDEFKSFARQLRAILTASEITMTTAKSTIPGTDFKDPLINAETVNL